ncbi:hypothetical protein [Pseudomonas sp. LA5]|uniref:hypothetical protein n=1 Tax=Pseudomonas sp. LA5 TaxID=3027850 RepID=UPI00235F94CA|nr:hypothetical protein [Pseudomonas sp. LA5]
MTINIAIATFDAIVLGCDSLSSQVEPAIFLRPNVGFARDADGNELVDAMGHKVVSTAHIEPLVTNVFGGAQKMFCLYEDEDTSVAAVTAGLATLSGVTIAGVASRFRKLCTSENRTFGTVRAVAEAFLAHVRVLWEEQVQFDKITPDEMPFQADVHFIIGGYGTEDAKSQVFKVYVKTSTIEEQFNWPTRSGTCFGGQSNFVERLLVGVDGQLAQTVERVMRAQSAAYTRNVTQNLLEELAAQGVIIPEGFTSQVPDLALNLPWGDQQASIDFGNLPTQYAVDLVELLVNLQSGMQRFANGVATVGGRTHVGVLKRGEKFTMLNEPKLVHNHTGYSHDL